MAVASPPRSNQHLPQSFLSPLNNLQEKEQAPLGLHGRPQAGAQLQPLVACSLRRAGDTRRALIRFNNQSPRPLDLFLSPETSLSPSDHYFCPLEYNKQETVCVVCGRLFTCDSTFAYRFWSSGKWIDFPALRRAYACIEPIYQFYFYF